MRRRSLTAVGPLSHNVMPHLPPPSQMPMSKHRPHAPSDMKKEKNAPISNMAIHKMCALPKRVCNCCSPAYRCQITVWHEVKYDEKVRRRKENNLGRRSARNINSACKSRKDRSNMYANGESSQNALPKPSLPLPHWIFEIPLQP